ncbi:MAG: hypothetical protein LBV67_01045 [Streptococcaceae bacterium]|jgi:Na+-driven multidrug efflux pump|nr:hypothetical protein [Streptococcaceae bacterium]
MEQLEILSKNDEQTVEEDTAKLDFQINTVNVMKFAIPTIVSMIAMSIFGTIDGIFVSRFLDVKSLSAVNIAMPILTATVAVGMMIATGGSALTARKKGEGKEKEARENFSLLIVFSTILSAIVAFFCWLFLDELLIHVLGADELILPLARDYILPVVIGMPIALIGFVMSKFLIVDGKPTLAMITSSSGGIISAGLNYILLGVLGLDIFWAGMGTTIGYLVPTIVGVIYFIFKKKEGLYFVRPKWDTKAVTGSFTSGVSEFITMFAWTITSTVMNNIVMNIGGFEGVAAVGIALGAQGIVTSIFVGYAFGIAPIVSYKHGKKNDEDIKKIYQLSMKIMTVLAILAIVMGVILASPLTVIYVPRFTNVYNMSVAGIRLMSASFVFVSFNTFATAFFTAFEDGWVSGMMAFMRSIVFIVATLLVIPGMLGTMTGVWIALPFAEVLAILVTIYYLKKMKKVYHYA